MNFNNKNYKFMDEPITKNKIYLMIDKAKDKLFKYNQNKFVDLSNINLNSFEKAYLSNDFSKVILFSSLKLYGNKIYENSFKLPSTGCLVELFYDKLIEQILDFINKNTFDVFYWDPLYITPIFQNDDKLISYFEFFELNLAPAPYFVSTELIENIKAKYISKNKANQDELETIDFLITEEITDLLKTDLISNQLNKIFENKPIIVPKFLFNNSDDQINIENNGIFEITQKENLCNFFKSDKNKKKYTFINKVYF